MTEPMAVNSSGHPQHHLRRVGPPATKRGVVDVMDFHKVTYMIGRSPGQVDYLLDSSDYVQSAMISRNHARLVRQSANHHRLFDDSLNGVFVNNIKISGSVVLQEGDRVTFGHPGGSRIRAGIRVRQPESEYQFIFEICTCTSRNRSDAARTGNSQRMSRSESIDTSGCRERTLGRSSTLESMGRRQSYQGDSSSGGEESSSSQSDEFTKPSVPQAKGTSKHVRKPTQVFSQEDIKKMSKIKWSSEETAVKQGDSVNSEKTSSTALHYGTDSTIDKNLNRDHLASYKHAESTVSDINHMQADPSLVTRAQCSEPSDQHSQAAVHSMAVETSLAPQHSQQQSESFLIGKQTTQDGRNETAETTATSNLINDDQMKSTEVCTGAPARGSSPEAGLGGSVETSVCDQSINKNKQIELPDYEQSKDNVPASPMRTNDSESITNNGNGAEVAAPVFSGVEDLTSKVFNGKECVAMQTEDLSGCKETPQARDSDSHFAPISSQQCLSSRNPLGANPCVTMTLAGTVTSTCNSVGRGSTQTREQTKPREEISRDQTGSLVNVISQSGANHNDAGAMSSPLGAFRTESCSSDKSFHSEVKGMVTARSENRINKQQEVVDESSIPSPVVTSPEPFPSSVTRDLLEECIESEETEKIMEQSSSHLSAFSCYGFQNGDAPHSNGVQNTDAILKNSRDERGPFNHDSNGDECDGNAPEKSFGDAPPAVECNNEELAMSTVGNVQCLQGERLKSWCQNNDSILELPEVLQNNDNVYSVSISKKLMSSPTNHSESTTVMESVSANVHDDGRECPGDQDIEGRRLSKEQEQLSKNSCKEDCFPETSNKHVGSPVAGKQDLIEQLNPNKEENAILDTCSDAVPTDDLAVVCLETDVMEASASPKSDEIPHSPRELNSESADIIEASASPKSDEIPHSPRELNSESADVMEASASPKSDENPYSPRELNSEPADVMEASASPKSDENPYSPRELNSEPADVMEASASPKSDEIQHNLGELNSEPADAIEAPASPKSDEIQHSLGELNSEPANVERVQAIERLKLSESIDYHAEFFSEVDSDDEFVLESDSSLGETKVKFVSEPEKELVEIKFIETIATSYVGKSEIINRESIVETEIFETVKKCVDLVSNEQMETCNIDDKCGETSGSEYCANGRGEKSVENGDLSTGQGSVRITSSHHTPSCQKSFDNEANDISDVLWTTVVDRGSGPREIGENITCISDDTTSSFVDELKTVSQGVTGKDSEVNSEADGEEISPTLLKDKSDSTCLDTISSDFVADEPGSLKDMNIVLNMGKESDPKNLNRSSPQPTTTHVPVSGGTETSGDVSCYGVGALLGSTTHNGQSSAICRIEWFWKKLFVIEIKPITITCDRRIQPNSSDSEKQNSQEEVNFASDVVHGTVRCDDGRIILDQEFEASKHPDVSNTDTSIRSTQYGTCLIDLMEESNKLQVQVKQKDHMDKAEESNVVREKMIADTLGTDTQLNMEEDLMEGSNKLQVKQKYHMDKAEESNVVREKMIADTLGTDTQLNMEEDLMEGSNKLQVQVKQKYHMDKAKESNVVREKMIADTLGTDTQLNMEEDLMEGSNKLQVQVKQKYHMDKAEESNIVREKMIADTLCIDAQLNMGVNNGVEVESFNQNCIHVDNSELCNGFNETSQNTEHVGTCITSQHKMEEDCSLSNDDNMTAEISHSVVAELDENCENLCTKENDNNGEELQESMESEKMDSEVFEVILENDSDCDSFDHADINGEMHIPKMNSHLEGNSETVDNICEERRHKTTSEHDGTSPLEENLELTDSESLLPCKSQAETLNTSNSLLESGGKEKIKASGDREVLDYINDIPVAISNNDQNTSCPESPDNDSIRRSSLFDSDLVPVGLSEIQSIDSEMVPESVEDIFEGSENSNQKSIGNIEGDSDDSNLDEDDVDRFRVRILPPLSPASQDIALSPVLPKVSEIGCEESNLANEGHGASYNDNSLDSIEPMSCAFDDDSDYSFSPVNLENLNSESESADVNTESLSHLTTKKCKRDNESSDDEQSFKKMKIQSESQNSHSVLKPTSVLESYEKIAALNPLNCNEPDSVLTTSVEPPAARSCLDRSGQQLGIDSSLPNRSGEMNSIEEPQTVEASVSFSNEDPTTSRLNPEDEHSPKSKNKLKARELLARLKAKRDKFIIKTEPVDESPVDDSHALVPINQAQSTVVQTQVQIDLEHVNNYQKRCADVFDRLKQTFNKQPVLESNPRVQAWREEMLGLEKKLKLPQTVIAVVGTTGAGKSSLMNAILDQANVLPTSGMRACTAVVVEIVANNKNMNYEADIEFLTRKEWYDELRLLLNDLTGPDGKVRSRAPDPNSEAGVAYSKIKSVYGRVEPFEVLSHINLVTRWLDRTKHISTTCPKQLRKLIDRYIETSVERAEGQYWPIIKQVRIYLPNCDACSSGAVLVDLPGNRDSNAARDKIAKEYLKKCTAVWVVADINRAVDDKTAKDLLGENFRRQLLMDGQYGNIGFVCTKTDILTPFEIIGSLKIENEAKPFEDDISILEVERFDTESCIKETKKDIKKLKKEIKQGEEECDEIQNDVVEATQLLDQSSMDSEDLDKSALDDLQTDITTRKASIAELRSILLQKRQSVEESERKLAEVEAKIAMQRKALKALCAKARNDYSRTQLRRDFKAGLREMKRKAGLTTDDGYEEMLDDDYYNDDDDDEEIGSTANNLRVFCVSAAEYQKMRNLRLTDGQSTVFSTLEDTQIPALRMFIHEMTSVRRRRATEQLIQSVGNFVFDMESYISDEGTKCHGTRTYAKSTIEEEIATLEQKLAPVYKSLSEDIRNCFRGGITPKLQDGLTNASDSAKEICAKWGSKPNRENREKGGLHWCTYRATVRRDGVFNSPSWGPVDFNEQLVEPMYRNISISWDKVFSGLLWSKLEACKSLVVGILTASSTKICKQLQEMGVAQPRTDRAKMQLIGNARNKLTELITSLKEHVTNRQRDISRVLTPTVQGELGDTYASCASQSGPGMYNRMKDILSAAIDCRRYSIFDHASQTLLKDLDNLQSEIVGMVKLVCGTICKDLRVAFEPLWEAPSNSQILRHAMLESITSICSEVRQMYVDAAVPVNDRPLIPEQASTISNTNNGSLPCQVSPTQSVYMTLVPHQAPATHSHNTASTVDSNLVNSGVPGIPQCVSSNSQPRVQYISALQTSTCNTQTIPASTIGSGSQRSLSDNPTYIVMKDGLQTVILGSRCLTNSLPTSTVTGRPIKTEQGSNQQFGARTIIKLESKGHRMLPPLNIGANTADKHNKPFTKIKSEREDPVSQETYQRILTSLAVSNTENVKKGGISKLSQTNTKPCKKKVNKMHLPCSETKYSSQRWHGPSIKQEPVEAKKPKTSSYIDLTTSSDDDQ
ncbi:hypothetical protein ScPMuIL_001715 [Solemya velum]